MTTRRIAGRTPDLPAPAGPYSPSVRIGDLIACAGQAGFTADGTLVEGVAAQTRQALTNLALALKGSGASLGDVLHVRVYLTDPAQFAEMNSAYESFFEAPYPARTTVTVTLPEGLLVEIDALAAAAAS